MKQLTSVENWWNRKNKLFTISIRQRHVKWRPYLKQGVNDWNKAFEAAGFKNAIVAKDAPSATEDPEWSPEDARYSVIRYFASNIENAYGPNVADPRSGEIIESDIGWYHNVMNLLRNWYFIQTAAINPDARKTQFKDEIMGQLIRFVSSHEVGHTLRSATQFWIKLRLSCRFAKIGLIHQEQRHRALHYGLCSL